MNSAQWWVLELEGDSHQKKLKLTKFCCIYQYWKNVQICHFWVSSQNHGQYQNDPNQSCHIWWELGNEFCHNSFRTCHFNGFARKWSFGNSKLLRVLCIKSAPISSDCNNFCANYCNLHQFCNNSCTQHELSASMVANYRAIFSAIIKNCWNFLFLQQFYNKLCNL